MPGDYSDIPYVQAAHFGGVRPSTSLIVIHATDNTASDEDEASYESHRPESVSAHFTNDGDSIIQSVPLANIAYGCLYHGNLVSVQFELCGKSGNISDATLRHAAPTVRRVCNRYGIPMRKVSASQVRAGVAGICGHGDVTSAWPEDDGDHYDPGSNFPWSTFINYVISSSGERLTSMGIAEYSPATATMGAIGATDKGGAGTEVAWDKACNYFNLRALVNGELPGTSQPDSVESTKVYNLKVIVQKLNALEQKINSLSTTGISDAQVITLANALAEHLPTEDLDATAVEEVLRRVLSTLTLKAETDDTI